MNILVPNLGSTSLKYQLLDMPSERVLSKGRLERVSDYHDAVKQIDTGGHPIQVVAFKAVLAGPRYRGTFLINDDLMAAMEDFLPAAPAHNAIYLTGIRAFRETMPGVPLVAAFETEFHTTIPDYAGHYGVPEEWRARSGIRRYGFHGASHAYISERVPEILGVQAGQIKLVSCHLGGSSSLCAVDGGVSVDTTMGFSPQSGLENATRHGELDIFAVLYMMDRNGWDTEQVRRQLSRTGGLAGISGIAGGDVRDIEKAAAGGNAQATLALELFAYQVRKTIGGYAAAMGGIDAIAFTGGIGENSARLRANCCRGLEFLGVRLDRDANESGQGDRVISTGDSRVAVVTLATNEELNVARRAFKLVGARQATAD
ncbi:MAG TPA: acetate/propionate family kinase [Bryobacteraceae bacterium]|nr:acetate/propionate family kinase [Bryobacteraceae bacterium]